MQQQSQDPQRSSSGGGMSSSSLSRYGSTGAVQQQQLQQQQRAEQQQHQQALAVFPAGLPVHEHLFYRDLQVSKLAGEARDLLSVRGCRLAAAAGVLGPALC